MKNKLKTYNSFISENLSSKIDSKFIDICVELANAYNEFNMDINDNFNNLAFDQIPQLDKFIDFFCIGTDSLEFILNESDFIDINKIKKIIPSLKEEDKLEILYWYDAYKALENKMPNISYIQDRFLSISDEYSIDITKFFHLGNFTYEIRIDSNFAQYSGFNNDELDTFLNFMSTLKHIKEIIQLEHNYILFNASFSNSDGVFIEIYRGIID